MVLLDIQHYGKLAAQVFFGLWLAPLGYLAYRSGLFPKALGVVLVLATISESGAKFCHTLLLPVSGCCVCAVRRNLAGARASKAPDQRRTTPAVRPWMNRRWSTTNRSKGGRITIAIPANVSP